MSTHCHSLICLGDSYTIGESVALYAGFPYQTIQLLRSAGLHFHAPEIIAKTGWASFELAEHLVKLQLNDSYDFVSLLIGVNNHYRELDVESFSEDLSFLIKKAIHLTGGNSNYVYLMSIPDWTITTFGRSNKKNNTADTIASFNETCKLLSLKNGCNFIDLTKYTNLAETDLSLLAADGLHYSEKAYAYWAKELANKIQESIHQKGK
ncbi:MAG: GDSL-type esterase/lipase family protein [Bacteroidetes bacterium]|nr:GDSL-type esterase/lipase family protein [Bacteroidota bacterium]